MKTLQCILGCAIIIANPLITNAQEMSKEQSREKIRLAIEKYQAEEKIRSEQARLERLQRESDPNYIAQRERQRKEGREKSMRATELLRQATPYLQKKDWQTAEKYLQEAYALNSNDTRFPLITALRHQGKFEEALNLLSVYLRLDKEYHYEEVDGSLNERYAMEYALIAEKIGYQEDAYKIYRHIIRWNNALGIKSFYERMMKSRGTVPTQVEDLKKQILDNPSYDFTQDIPYNANLVQLRALAMVARADFLMDYSRPQVADVYREALQLNRNIPIGHYLLGKELERQCEDLPNPKVLQEAQEHFAFAVRYGKGKVRTDAKQAHEKLSAQIKLSAQTQVSKTK
jgi:tetratricopeptide (TPR) repeat protein